MAKSKYTRSIAHFPRCPHCGSSMIEPVSQNSICVKVLDYPPQTFAKSEAAAALRFIEANKPRLVTKQQLSAALGGCVNISRTLRTLRKRLGPENVQGIKFPKVNGSGTYKGFSLSDTVRVREPKEEGKSDDE